jgi:hypothetical protein
MDTWTDAELIEVYEAMFQSQMDGTFDGKEEAIRLVTICSILGDRGYTLTPDETTWIRDQDK